MIVHGGCLALRIGGDWLGALITGASGAGKSDLALRLLRDGWSIVSDDRTVLWTAGGALYARAPETIAGLIEARGLGVVTVPRLRQARVALVLEDGEDERIPPPTTTALLGVDTPRVRLPLRHASTPAALRLALFAAGRGRLLESAGTGRI